MNNSSTPTQAILGTVIGNPEFVDEMRSKLTRSDIFGHENKQIFDAIIALNEQGIGVNKTSLMSILDEDINPEYHLDLCLNLSEPASFNDYVALTKDASLKYKIENLCNSSKEDLRMASVGQASSILNQMSSKLDSLIEDGISEESTMFTVSEKLPEFMANLQKQAELGDQLTGLPTGIDGLDDVTSGLQDTDLIVVAARPSMGKTTAVLNWIANIAKNKGKVIVFSLEMPGEQLMIRLLSQLSGVEMDKIKKSNYTQLEFGQVSQAIKLLNSLEIVIDDCSSLNPTEMRLKIMKEEKKGKVRAVMVDYLQLMNAGDAGIGPENKTLEIGHISRSLKKIAKDFDLPMLALAQLNRGLEQRADKRPVNSDLRESGAIEQDADIIMFIYRDEVYNEDSPDKGIAEFIIGKHRNGPLATIRVKFEGHLSRFTNIASEKSPSTNPVIETPPKEGYTSDINPEDVQTSLIDLKEIPM